MVKLGGAFFLLGGALLDDALGEQPLGPLQLGAARGAEAASGAIDEISQHAHAGAGALWRNSLRSQRARDGGSLLRKESAGRMSGIGGDFCDPAFFAAFRGHTFVASCDAEKKWSVVSSRRSVVGKTNARSLDYALASPLATLAATRALLGMTNFLAWSMQA